ncbi:uncharacterized protein LOC130980933 [Arachis stenosperma]|uniref:uncharacterized protein LOC130980933 n=1 Tax=Arachis stenosperma TaxID=217475 RepID=UPI0025AD7C4E|nr:uncharacterized protein LOC130980933 [Arachis stenosperma]
MVNWKWMQIYQNAILKASPAVSSDHCALILKTQPLVRIKKEFRFEAFWAEHEECKEVIKRSWHLDDGNRSCWNQFVRKRNRCKRELTEWSRRKFKRADKEIERKKTELQHIQKFDMSESEQRRANELKSQISELWKQEEKRNRNRIDKLRNESGQWIQGEDNIMRLVEGHFTKLYTSIGVKNMEECIREIPRTRRVTREMNEELMAKIKDEEIKEATFSMGGLKAPGPDGRLIQDNIIIVQEAFHKFSKKGSLGNKDLAIKLDMNKAYDRLEWDFLERVLEAFGFCNEWVKLMMNCVKSASYRFKINGKLSRRIGPQRELRQGDPLSPYLFILAAESFTILMEKAARDNLISGIRLAPTAPPITHLLFANDCIIFTGAQEDEIYQLIQIINKYTEASGQRINTEKSGLIFGSQVPIQSRVNIEEITGMASWEDPGRYLGLPARWGR